MSFLTELMDGQCSSNQHFTLQQKEHCYLLPKNTAYEKQPTPLVNLYQQ
jgi:hypothetical protein